MKFLPKSKYVDYGWLFVLFAILLFAMLYSIFFGKTGEGFTSHSDINNGKKLVYFYIEGCQYCKDMSPVWDKVSAKGANSDKMIKVDANAQKDIADKYNVTSYPTILLLDKGTKKETYGEDRTEEALTKYVKDNL